MRRILAAIVVLALAWVPPLTLGAPASSNLTPRVTALEQQVADLQARVTALEAAATPTSAPSPTPGPSTDPNALPIGDLPGWHQAFVDDFTTWDPTRYFVYPSPWQNKNGTGTYDPTIISSDGANLRIHLHTDTAGVPRIAAFVPLPTGSFGRGDLPGMRLAFRIRADRMPGYIGVPLLWPWDRDNDPATDEWPEWGEIDSPDSAYDALPKAHIHLQGATSGGDQDSYSTPAGTSWQDWHTYVTEYIPGTRAEVFIDGRSFGRTIARVPEGPMHAVMQFETQLTQTKPEPTVAGDVTIAWQAVWAVAP
jgi:hypothetical protein